MTISIKEFCKAIGKSPEAFVGSRYNGDLDLRGKAITSLPKGLVVNGYLDLRETAVTSLPDSLVVVGGLNLSRTATKSLPADLVVGDDLYLAETAITSLPDDLVVGNWLSLCRTAIKTLPKGLVVGGSLDLSSTGITSLPDDLVVGDSLYLSSTAITSFLDNLLIDREIYRNEHLFEVNVRQLPPGYMFSWCDGKYVKIDGLFCEVLRKRGNVWHVITNLATRAEAVIVRDGDLFAHGKTVKEARESLLYKISNRDTTAYEGWKRSTVISKRDAIASYRAITGACEYGVRRFIESLSEVPESLTVAEVIELTNGQYRSDEYKKFFIKERSDCKCFSIRS